MKIKKSKVENKICDLEMGVEAMENEVKALVNSDCCNWPRVTELVNGMNIMCNQVNTLRKLYID